ncbi:MAG: hypothetical protein HY663_06660 [Chloroflexi bacterium]|nr:hypothetical protein [Chloroflexota bacterium]
MSEDLYAEKLAWFKQNEKPEVVLLVADDPDRIKLVIAWNNLNVKRTEKLTELKSHSENEIWEWLWENAEYSKNEFLEKIGIPFSESGLESKLKPLFGNRILYPDGTLNSFVQRYLRERVLKLFEAKPKRATKKTAE